MIEDAPDGAGLSDERDDEAAVAAGVAGLGVQPNAAWRILASRWLTKYDR